VQQSKTKPQTLGDYDLLERVGAGAVGTVFKARHRTTGQVVAIKAILAPAVGSSPQLKRFEQEFRAAKPLKHPNMVHTLDFIRVADTACLVMEFIDGETLGERLDRTGRFPESEALDLIRQVGEVLDWLHGQGVIHRDVKPDNIMVTRAGVAKLTDMGLAKEKFTDLSLTRTGSGLGTPHFMAPEQFRDAKHVDHRSDIYSLAATFYQLLTGELPFPISSPLEAWMKKKDNQFVPPRRIDRTIPDHIDRAVCRALNADPLLRPNSCREFLAELAGPPAAPVPLPDVPEPPADEWELVFESEGGEVYPLRGKTIGIRELLKGGLLHNARGLRVRRATGGPFQPLADWPEFRDLAGQADDAPPEPVVVVAAPARPPSQTARRLEPDTESNWPLWVASLVLVGLSAWWLLTMI
jgi:serine/threonine protein kinase